MVSAGPVQVSRTLKWLLEWNLLVIHENAVTSPGRSYCCITLHEKARIMAALSSAYSQKMSSISIPFFMDLSGRSTVNGSCTTR